MAARPYAIATLAAIVFVFGWIGFRHLDPRASVVDTAFRALQLFAFGGNPGTHPNTWLEIARLLAPLVVGYAAVAGVIAVYREQFQLLRSRMMRNHVVIAGLGSAGLMMAEAFEREYWRVLAIEQDPANPAIKSARERGIGVLVGDATDWRILRKAALRRAILLVAMCGDDGTNVDVAAAARLVTRERRRGILTALAELDDFGLWGVMKAQALLDRDDSPFRLEMFNASALGAEMLLREHPPFDRADPGSPHILIVGTAGAGVSLVVNAMNAWLCAARSPGDRLRITLAGTSADAERARLIVRYPGIGHVPDCELASCGVDLIAAAHPEGVPDDVTAVYVSLASETHALKVALTLRQQAGWEHVPIVVAVADQEAGVGSAINRGGPALERVSAFGVLRSSLTPQALMRTATERIAELSHECHLRDRQARGDSERDDPSLVPWTDLPHALRESNRLFADGIPAKLATLGCVVYAEPLPDPASPPFVLSEEEIEQLAPDEHTRWEEHMKRIGYRRGERKDHQLRTHPMIDVPYETLPEENKKNDRAHVRSIPEILAGAGFAIRRVGDSDAQPTQGATLADGDKVSLPRLL